MAGTTRPHLTPAAPAHQTNPGGAALATNLWQPPTLNSGDPLLATYPWQSASGDPPLPIWSTHQATHPAPTPPTPRTLLLSLLSVPGGSPSFPTDVPEGPRGAENKHVNLFYALGCTHQRLGEQKKFTCFPNNKSLHALFDYKMLVILKNAWSG